MKKYLGNSSCPTQQKMSLEKASALRISQNSPRNILDKDLCVKTLHFPISGKCLQSLISWFFFQVWYLIAVNEH